VCDDEFGQHFVRNGIQYLVLFFLMHLVCMGRETIYIDADIKFLILTAFKIKQLLLAWQRRGIDKN
jgi:hypothetical protein